MPEETSAAVGQGSCGGKVHVRLTVGHWMNAAAFDSSIRTAHVHTVSGLLWRSINLVKVSRGSVQGDFCKNHRGDRI